MELAPPCLLENSFYIINWWCLWFWLTDARRATPSASQIRKLGESELVWFGFWNKQRNVWSQIWHSGWRQTWSDCVEGRFARAMNFCGDVQMMRWHFKGFYSRCVSILSSSLRLSLEGFSSRRLNETHRHLVQRFSLGLDFVRKIWDNVLRLHNCFLTQKHFI